MLHFLRRIRRSLIGNGATRKYLLYAIGEVILVMVGILLALQVNNWNEERKIRNELVEFLIALNQELQIDIETFTEKKSLYIEINENIQATLKFIETYDEIGKEEEQIISEALKLLPWFTPIIKNTNKYDSIISEGKLENAYPKLNENLIRYLDNILQNSITYEKLGEFTHQIHINLHDRIRLKLNVVPRVVEFNFSEMKKDLEVYNALQKSFWWRDFYIIELEEVIVQAEELSKMIDEVLPN
jgi:hypothetical protein